MKIEDCKDWSTSDLHRLHYDISTSRFTLEGIDRAFLNEIDEEIETREKFYRYATADSLLKLDDWMLYDAKNELELMVDSLNHRLELVNEEIEHRKTTSDQS